MKLIHLSRIDERKNMHRFYRLEVQPTLFGEFALVREWGRIGSAGQVRSTTYVTVNEAEAARDKLRRIKELRGYEDRRRAAS